MGTCLSVTGLLLLALGCDSRPSSNTAETEDDKDNVHVPNGVTVEYLLTPKHTVSLGDGYRREFDVEPDGAVIIGNDRGLLAIKSGHGHVDVDQVAEDLPDSFALDGRGAILCISGQFLGQIEDQGASKLVPLPYPGMRLQGSSIPGAIYAIGGRGETTHRVYTYFSDGTLQIEAEIPEDVVAVADNRNAVYLASRHSLFRVTSTAIDVVARLPDAAGDIVSVAVAPDDSSLYFATEGQTFLMSGLTAVAIVKDMGGTIRVRNGKLYVWSPMRHILISLSGMQALYKRG